MALELFKPFVMKTLWSGGLPRTQVRQRMIDK